MKIIINEVWNSEGKSEEIGRIDAILYLALATNMHMNGYHAVQDRHND